MFKLLLELFVWGTYGACLFGVGFPLLPFAIGAHVFLWTLPGAEVKELEDRVEQLEEKA